MKTDPSLQAPATGEASSAFHTLLDRQVQPHHAPHAPVKADGIAIGALVSVGEDGAGIQVRIPGLGLGPLPAVSMVRLGPQHAGHPVALGFEGGDAHRPVVLGLMMGPVEAPGGGAMAGPPPVQSIPEEAQGGPAVRVTRDGGRVVVEAHAELELRCGEAVILLSEDGSIQIRGAYVTTHASASNRIRGGSVQIN